MYQYKQCYISYVSNHYAGGLSFAVNKPIAAVMMLLDLIAYEDIQVIIVWVALTFT